jgi:hypothetical protein
VPVDQAGVCTKTLEMPLMPTEKVIKKCQPQSPGFAFGEESLEKQILYINQYRGGRDAQLLLRILQSEGEITYEYTRR